MNTFEWPFVAGDNQLVIPQVTEPIRRLEVWLRILLLTERGERELRPEFGLPMFWQWRGCHDCMTKLILGLNSELSSIAAQCGIAVQGIRIPNAVTYFPEPPPKHEQEIYEWKRRFRNFANDDQRMGVGLIYATPIRSLVPVSIRIINEQLLLSKVFAEIPVSRWCYNL